jgi:hypothetical protein
VHYLRVAGLYEQAEHGQSSRGNYPCGIPVYRQNMAGMEKENTVVCSGFHTFYDFCSVFMRETELVSRWSYLCTQFNVLVIYIRLLFLPIGQNLDYLYPFKSGFFDGYTPLAFMFLAGLAALGIWNRKKWPIITFGIFWFFITLSVESGIIPIRDAVFEHRLYLPMFGFALIVSYLLFHLLSKIKERIMGYYHFSFYYRIPWHGHISEEHDLARWRDTLVRCCIQKPGKPQGTK